MTTPAHDSVAYLPARPRLALLRKEADQLISFCLPCPLGLVFCLPGAGGVTRRPHDSVAYLPARPRLALLRKEADQLTLCLYPLAAQPACWFRAAPYPSPVRRLDGACVRRLPRRGPLILR